MSSRDEEKIKKMLKSVRPDYDKAGLWDQIEDKLPQAEKKRGASVWLFLAIGLFAGVGLSYSWFQLGMPVDVFVVEKDGGSGTQSETTLFMNDIVLRNEDKVNNESTSNSNSSSFEKSELEQTSLITRIESKEIDNIQASKINRKGMSMKVEKEETEFIVSGNEQKYKNQNSVFDASFESNNVALKIQESPETDPKDKIQGLMIENSAPSSTKGNSTDDLNSLRAGDLEQSTLILNSKSLPRLDINYLAINTPSISFSEYPIIQPEQRSSQGNDFLTFQTSSSVFFEEAGYISSSEEWNETMQEAINPVWNQSVNITYERGLGSGFYATMGIRAILLTERLETVVENAHQPDVHYSDTAFYYQFDNGIINYYGGQTQYQDKEVRRVGQYNQSLSVGAQLGIKYIKSWSKWSIAPEAVIYAMPYSFTSGKMISQNLDIVRRSASYQGFYGLQGQCSIGYQLNSTYRVFAGVNYQVDLSNRLRNQSQKLTTAGLNIGTSICL